MLTYSASVESHSEHPIARGITKAAEERGVRLKEASNVEALPGKGLKGRVNGKEVMGVSPVFVMEKQLSFDQERFNQWSEEGKTVIFTLIDGQVSGMIALDDMIRETAKEAILELKEIQIKMLTGDNLKVAQYFGNKLGVDAVFAEVLSHQKSDKIEQI